MRILVISNYLYPLEIGGWGQLTRDVSLLLRQRGHDVHILTSNYRAAESPTDEIGVERILHLESPDREFYRAHYLWTRRQREQDNKTMLAQAVQSFQPDIIYVNGMWNLPHSLVQYAEQLCPERVVYYIASYWPTELDAHTAYWRDTGEYTRFPWLKKMAATVVLPTVVRATPRNQLQFARVLCVSGYMRDYMIQEAGAVPEQVFIVHNGIEAETFTPRSAEFSHPKLRLIYAGRLDWNKGVHTILESLVHLRQERPDLSLEFSVVGSGAFHYERRLKWLVNEHQLQDRVRFVGRVPREEMPRVLKEHEVFLFTSIWPEPLARSIQEAMACGLVVIGTTTGGTPEILHDGENGLTFIAEDSQMLAEKIAQVAADRSLWAKLSKAARQTVTEKFTMMRMVDELEFHFAAQSNHS